MNENDTPLRETLAAWLRDEGHEAVVQAPDERYGEVFFRARGPALRGSHGRTRPVVPLHPALNAHPDDIHDELIARRAAGLIESQAKVVKVEVQWDARALVISAEQFVAVPGGASIFWRTIGVLDETFIRLRQAFDEEAGRDAAARFPNSSKQSSRRSRRSTARRRRRRTRRGMHDEPRRATCRRARGAGYVAVSEGPWVTFKVEGTQHRFETFANDERYARLLSPTRCRAMSAIERLLVVANEQNRKTKAVKTSSTWRRKMDTFRSPSRCFSADANAWVRSSIAHWRL